MSGFKVNPLNNVTSTYSREPFGRKPSAEKGSPSFVEVLKGALEEVNDSQLEAQKLAREFALGRVDNIHTVTIAAQKAELALDLTVAIRNKLIDAYKELMRMQF